MTLLEGTLRRPTTKEMSGEEVPRSRVERMAQIPPGGFLPAAGLLAFYGAKMDVRRVNCNYLNYMEFF
jgi:hypothetical protein